MGRKPRLDFPGACHHVVHRGNYKQQVYVVQNPVLEPAEYPWSSHRDSMGRRRSAFLDPDPVLALFGPRARDAQEAYGRFVGSPHPPGIPAVDETVSRTPQAIPPERAVWAEVLETVCRSYGLDGRILLSRARDGVSAEARAVAALLGQERCGMLLSEVARKLGRGLPAVSRAVSRIRQELCRDPALADRVATIRRQLSNA